jgi:hypothetical protein
VLISIRVCVVKQSGTIKHLHVHAWICKCQIVKTLYVDQTPRAWPRLHLYSTFASNGFVYRHFHLSTHKSNFRFFGSMVGCFVVDAFPARVRVCYWPPTLTQRRGLCRDDSGQKSLQKLQSQPKCWYTCKVTCPLCETSGFAAKSLRTALFWVITQRVTYSLRNNPEERSSPMSTKQFSQNLLRPSEKKINR